MAGSCEILLAFLKVFRHIPPPLGTDAQFVRKDPLLNDISALETSGSGRSPAVQRARSTGHHSL